MDFDKNAFLVSKLGVDLVNTLKNLERMCDKLSHSWVSEDLVQYEIARKMYMERLSVHKMWIKELYGVDYIFTRTDSYFGLVTEDESDWLIKINKN